jgi:hypothetical protein
MQVAVAKGIMNTDSQSLLSAGHCYVCFGASTFQSMKLALLASISTNHNPANQTDPQTLLTQAKCFACFSEASTPRLMELALLAQIAS